MSAPLVLSFADIGASDLPRVGGKGANLGEMTRHGFAVPPGFCVTTEAFTRFMEGSGQGEAVYAELEALEPGDIDGTARAGARVRERLLSAPIPAEVAEAVVAALRSAGASHAYAVRSSATAEDLPGASFAGQQDTYLNVRGEAALLDAMRACWASLFTDRAIHYRAQNGFSHRDVRLSVVVQRMIFPDLAGILFTADPVTGHRGISTIDASYGLGEALVSGLVTADLYRVDKRSRRIVERRIGDKRIAFRPAPGGGTRREDVPEELWDKPSLTDAQALALTDVGARIEAHYGMPMDIEWGIEAGEVFVLQARPVTSLFPLPEPRPAHGRLGVYVSFGHVQVMTRPMPPMASSIWRYLFPFGKPNGSTGPNPLLATAAGRLYIDVSPLLRRQLGRRLAFTFLPLAEELIAGALGELVARGDLDGDEPGGRASMGGVAAFMLPVLARTQVLAWLEPPEDARSYFTTAIERVVAEARARIEGASVGAGQLRAAREVVSALFGSMLHRFMPYVASGMMSKTLIERLTRDKADPDDVAALWRGLSGNVTTEMDLAVGDLADHARGSEALVAWLAEGQDARTLLENARKNPGCEAFVRAWDEFMNRYGMRGPSEIDVSRPRYRDEPGTLLQQIASGVLHGEPFAHRAHHARLCEAGEAAAARISEQARSGRFGVHGALVIPRLVRVARTLLALREHPKFMLIRILGEVRAALFEAGGCLVEAGRLDAPDDIFFFELDEAIDAFEDRAVELREKVRSRRDDLANFEKMRPPRAMTSEGEILEVRHASEHLPEGALPGTGVSAGIVEGVARVVLDPAKERLMPGEILVAPFTDPGWTPLFIHAAGLVMEVGGMMTHGSVIAREYGIPAVVGVLDATRTIRTGQRVRVHGDGGYVEVLPEAELHAAV